MTVVILADVLLHAPLHEVCVDAGYLQAVSAPRLQQPPEKQALRRRRHPRRYHRSLDG